MKAEEDTNPLPHVSSARAWTALTLPKAVPVIRDKVVSPKPPRRLRADGTEEICADDIMLIVPATTRQPSSEELGDADIEIEHAEPVKEDFHPPAYSIHATQEILADDVLEVVNRPLPAPMVEERPSSIPPPWTVDAQDDFEFPTPPQYSGQHPAISARITAFSATQVFRRRSANMKVVIACVGLAASLMIVAGIARLAPSASASDGPVGIAVHAPKKLDSAVRARVLAYGRATRAAEATEVAAVSIDALPESRPVRHHRR